MADISAPYNEIIRRRIESAGVPQTKGGALAQGLGMVPQEVQGTTLEDLQKNSLNNVFGFPEIGMKEIYQAGLGLGQKVNEGLGMVSRLPTTATEYLTSPSAAAEAIAAEGITDNSIFEATDIPDIMFERKPGESRDDFKNRFLETDPKFEKGKTTIKPGTEGLPKKRIPVDVKADPLQNREPKTMYDIPSEPMPDADPAEQLFSQAMTDYISQARTGAEDKLPEVGDIEAYKKKFAEATGVDISGKPDTSQALMAMGLSMMQNRAGKGFNVGRMLSSVGEAGEKALPALTAAKAEARNNVIAAGKYALTAQDADEKTRKAAEKDLMNRGNYWIYKKGGKQGEFLRDKNGIMPFDEGSFEYLNKSEMNKLINDPEFNKQFSFIDADKRFEILKSRAEALGDKDDQWMEYDNRSMIGGELKDTPRDLIAFAAAKNSNVSGQKTNFKMGETAQTVVDRFQGLQRTINRGGDQFETLINAIDTGISIPKQIASTVVTLGRNLGLDLGDGPTDIKTAQTMLKQIAVREATNILQESGKTLSDNDRKRVEELVGEIDFSSGDKALVKKKLKEIHYLTVIKPQQNLDKAVGWLEREAGITFGVKGSPEGIGEPPTKSELAKMNVRRKEAGQPPYTMDMFE